MSKKYGWQGGLDKKRITRLLFLQIHFQCYKKDMGIPLPDSWEWVPTYTTSGSAIAFSASS